MFKFVALGCVTARVTFAIPPMKLIGVGIDDAVIVTGSVVVPVPVTLALSVGALLTTVNVPFAVPGAVGVKLPVKPHIAPGAKGATHPPAVAANGAVPSKLVNVTGMLPTFVTGTPTPVVVLTEVGPGIVKLGPVSAR